MSANENGRPSAEAVESPVAAVERVSAPDTAYPQSNHHVLPMGATPFTRIDYVDARDWMTEPADMGDAAALEYAPLDALNFELWRLFFAARGIAL